MKFFILSLCLLLLLAVSAQEDMDNETVDDAEEDEVPEIEVESEGESEEEEQEEEQEEVVEEPQELLIETLVENDCTRESVNGDVMTVLYTGSYNGTTFDASEDYKAPFIYQLGMGQVIPGFETGTTGMIAGDELRLTIPAQLAYGEQGLDKIVPPNATVEYVVMALRVQDGMTMESINSGECEHHSELVDWMTVKLEGRVVNGSVIGEYTHRFLLGARDTILGFQWGLIDMCEEDSRRLVIPPNLAYGEAGYDLLGIPANAWLDLNVTLITFKESLAVGVEASLAITILSAVVALLV